jgi:Rrf2 family cysteine metabolism transcriptional repressor
MYTISNKAKYALATMFELALANTNSPIQAKQVANRCNIPIKFLEHILSDLRQAGVVISQRGPHGGYFLAKPSEDITVGDIVSIIDGPITLSETYCGCIILTEFWQSVESDIETIMGVPLSELVFNKQKKEKVVNYAI